MNTIRTLTVNGSTYPLPDPQSVLDDSTQSPSSTWSSRKIAAVEEAASIVCDAAGGQITLTDASNRELQGLTLYGKTTQNGIPTPETPVPLESAGAGGAINTTVCGKNLVDASKFSEHTHLGITFANTADGGVHVSGASTGYVNTNVLLTLPKGKYTVSGVNSVLNYAYVYAQKSYTDGTVQTIYAGNVVEIDGTETGIRCFVQVHPNVTVNTTIYPMLEAGETVTAYEPHKPTQILTFSTPNGLPGIPVSSGGNYTDESGQAWICDEIDLGRGVYVRRIDVLDGKNLSWVLAGSNNVADGNVYYYIAEATEADVLSDRFGLTAYSGWGELAVGKMMISKINTQGIYIAICVDASIASVSALKEWMAENDTEFMTIRLSPIETALPDETLAAYAALHTVKPNTTVYNDSGAEMKLSYVADTKTYIDRKLAALTQEVTA